jgi:non-catalytic primase subunit PriX-like protein
LIQNKIDKIYERKMEIEKNLSIYKPLGRQDNKIEWIENLLQTPIEDFRKQCLWQILCPYLVNIRKLANEEVETILNEWLQKCSNLRKIDFNPQIKIKDDLKNVKKYLPPSKEKLKNEYKELYHIFRSKNILHFE